jgi:hypothetical protein
LLGELVVVAPCAGVAARRGRRAAAPLAEVTTPSRNAAPGKLRARRCHDAGELVVVAPRVVVASSMSN